MQELRKTVFKREYSGPNGAVIKRLSMVARNTVKKAINKDHRYPLLVHTLFDVNLLIHICAQSDLLLYQLEKLFRNPPYFLYLGRAEDLVKIEESKIINIESKTLPETYRLPLNAYVSQKDARRLRISGVSYHLPTFSQTSTIETKQTDETHTRV